MGGGKEGEVGKEALSYNNYSDWIAQTDMTLDRAQGPGGPGRRLSSQCTFLALLLFMGLNLHMDHKMHPMKRGWGAKTHLLGHLGKQGVGPSHPGQKDKCLSDLPGVVGGGELDLGALKGSPHLPRYSSLSPGFGYHHGHWAPLCHSSGIQGPKTGYTKSFG